MSSHDIPQDVRRFIVASVPSVPHLEAILLLRGEPERRWDVATVSRRLYVGEQSANDVLQSLCGAGVVSASGTPPAFGYAPRTTELREVIDRLAAVYTTHLVEMTHLIHAGIDKKARQFADAFKLHGDK